MKILKIDKGNGHYRTTEDDNDWKTIDQISKDDLMNLLNLLLENDVEMDEFDEEELKNQAHQIIYRNIYKKFSSLAENKSRFKDESERAYYDELQKYSNASQAE